MQEIKDLKITDIMVWNEDGQDQDIGISLSWSANIGCGEYTIRLYNGEWYVNSERMEDPEDREFGRLVLSTWLDSLKDNPKYMFGFLEE